ncbi:hypothetical protein GEMRC1_005012 [Eukaryota sp. GEM-RC1]
MWLSFSPNCIKSQRVHFEPFNVVIDDVIDQNLIGSWETEAQVSVMYSLEQHRLVFNHSTKYSNVFEPLLRQALFSYENERLFGVSVSSDLFAQSVHHLVPDNFTFRAVPVQIKSPIKFDSIGQIVLTSLNSTVAGKELLSLESGEFSVVVSIYSYSQNIYALWILVAAIFENE